MCKNEPDNFGRPNVDYKRAFVLFLRRRSTCYLQCLETVRTEKVRVCWLQNLNIYSLSQSIYFVFEIGDVKNSMP